MDVRPEEPIAVVGIGANGFGGLGPAARAEVEAAEVLFGSSRQLELVPETPEINAKRVEWPSPLLPALDGLLAEHDGRRRCVLASGDPLLNGIGGTLVRRYGPQHVRVIPGISSATLARARMGWTFDETEVVSTVARSVHRVLRTLAPGRRVVVLSSGAETPGELARVLHKRGWGASRMTVLENLGADDERRLDGTATDWSHEPGSPLNLVALECAPDAGTQVLGVTPGLPDEAFEHDGQLTKRDLRASALARLAPIPGELLWDIGAGAGSVAIEWLRTHPANRATAVERDAERATRIGRNAKRLGVPDLRVIVGEAPDSLPHTENPDAIFVGGGTGTPGLLQTCRARLRPGGRLVAHAVTLESEQALAAAYAEHGGELTRIAVERAAPLGTLTGWTPARTVTQWSMQL